MLAELAEVPGRGKFAKFTTPDGIAAFVTWFAETRELVEVTRSVGSRPIQKTTNSSRWRSPERPIASSAAKGSTSYLAWQVDS